MDHNLSYVWFVQKFSSLKYAEASEDLTLLHTSQFVPPNENKYECPTEIFRLIFCALSSKKIVVSHHLSNYQKTKCLG